jgi:hypothetical protein
MIVTFLNDLKKIISQFQPNLSILNSDSSLDVRMRERMNKFNGKTYHGFKPFVVSLKSKQLLNYINHLGNINEKIKELELIQDVLFDVSKRIYKTCDPHLIYTFQNEINVVFYYNENGVYLFNGNIMKTVTSLASFVSVEVSKLLYKRGIDIDLHFTGQFVDFDVDYEVLNYLVWRQMDCRRNTITLLYKCFNIASILDGQCSIESVKLDEMINSLNVNMLNIEEFLYHLLRGNVIKKRVFNTKKDEKIVTRRSVGVEHVKFSEDFKTNYTKYIVNKLC